MIVKVANVKFLNTKYNFTLPISKKVEYILDDIFESIGIQANNPNRVLNKYQLDDFFLSTPKNILQ